MRYKFYNCYIRSARVLVNCAFKPEHFVEIGASSGEGNGMPEDYALALINKWNRAAVQFGGDNYTYYL